VEEKRKRELFEPAMNKAKEQRQVRKELEKAYEREKSKVSGLFLVTIVAVCHL
jgi:hypothetical protein